MTRAEMQAILNREDLSGVGVRVQYTDGKENYFFYENFNNSDVGMDRAAHQLAYEVRRGVVKGFSFIQHQDGLEVEEVPVGVIEYLHCSGESEVLIFYDHKKYLEEYKEALDTFGPIGGCKATMIVRDPECLKAADNALYDVFGEENPNDIEYQTGKGSLFSEEEQEYEGEDLEL